jgi:hypothetical protein
MSAGEALTLGCARLLGEIPIPSPTASSKTPARMLDNR